MPAVNGVDIPLCDERGIQRGVVHIHLLPNGPLCNVPPLLDLREDSDRDTSLEPIQVVEAWQYRYRIHLNDPGLLTCNRPEIFEADDYSNLTGRLRPGLATGVLSVVFRSNGNVIGQIKFEVRSRKIDYVTQYRSMLRDLADTMAEVVMERFATAEQRFDIGDTTDNRTLYQRFAFLSSLLRDEFFDSALRRILHSPHVTWQEELEFRAPGQGLRANGNFVRSFSKGGPKAYTTSGDVSLDGRETWRSHVPHRLAVHITEETVDNHPNRFLKFVLTRWRDDTARVLDILEAEGISDPVTRGKTEVQAVLHSLDELLSFGFFRDVGRLTQLPSGSTVLMNKAGYRDVYRAFLQSEVAGQLTWDDSDDIFSAGQKNVAALYELWVFFKLAGIVSELCDTPFDLSTLIEVDSDALNVKIKRGRAVSLKSKLTRYGRELKIELWFNRTFSRSTGEDTSWTKTMRPDYSLRIDAEGGDDIWVHFDAKYRVDGLEELFGDEIVESDLPEFDTSSIRRAKNADLLKMHGYKDAIRRSAGAYVIYPGDVSSISPEYKELIPGLGAFGLTPSPERSPSGATDLRNFIDKLASELASQVTQYSRGRYWERESFKDTAYTAKSTSPALFLKAPPLDTPIVIGYVKGERHWNWIDRAGFYNVRADDRVGSVPLHGNELAAELLILYSLDRPNAVIYQTGGPVKILTRNHMLKSGYPDPQGALYFCFSISRIVDPTWLAGVPGESVQGVVSRLRDGEPSFAPLAASWFEFVEALETAR